MATPDDGQYTRVEYERRFLVRDDASWRAFVDADPRRVDDKYLHGTRMRLRVVTETASGHRVAKLTKKAESESPFFRTIGRILLSEPEYALFDRIDGDRLTKTRYHCRYAGRTFAVDLFDGPLGGLVLCEVEADSLDDLMRAEPPPFTWCEVTQDAFFDGINLSRATRADWLAKRSSFAAS
jgi:CYTH domain-containing protein